MNENEVQGWVRVGIDCLPEMYALWDSTDWHNYIVVYMDRSDAEYRDSEYIRKVRIIVEEK
jgi:hypothetical protein